MHVLPMIAFLLSAWGTSWAQDTGIATVSAALTATTTNQIVTLSPPVRSLSLCNMGSVTVYVKTQGDRIATASAGSSTPITAGECIGMRGSPGEVLQWLGLIAASGTVDVLVRGTAGD